MDAIHARCFYRIAARLLHRILKRNSHYVRSVLMAVYVRTYEKCFATLRIRHKIRLLYVLYVNRLPCSCCLCPTDFDTRYSNLFARDRHDTNAWRSKLNAENTFGCEPNKQYTVYRHAWCTEWSGEFIVFTISRMERVFVDCHFQHLTLLYTAAKMNEKNK